MEEEAKEKRTSGAYQVTIHRVPGFDSMLSHRLDPLFFITTVKYDC